MAPALIATPFIWGSVDVGATALAATAAYGGYKAMQSMTAGPNLPSVKQGQASTTAVPLVQTSEQEKQNKRLQASLLTKDWNSGFQLGTKGML
jgi:hypothetical protein